MVAVIVLAVSALVLYVAPLLPIVVALVTKATAPAALKAGILVVLSVVSALVTQAIADGTDVKVDRGFLARLVVTLAVAVAAHFGVLKPAGITGSEGKVATAVPGGLG